MSGIARRMGIPNDRVEQFVRESPWRYEDLQDHLVKKVPPAFRDPHAVLIVDDVGLLKKGKKSVGVHRQYTGASGKIDNCQVAVNVTLAVPGKGRNGDQKTWPLGMGLYLPEAWTKDEDRRREAGVPDDVVFQTKPQIALSILDRARGHGVPHRCVVADAGYGDGNEFRTQLRERNEPYIVGVTPSKLRVVDASIPLEVPRTTGRAGGRFRRPRHPERTPRLSPRQIANRVTQWETVSWAEGEKGALSGLFFRLRIRVADSNKPELRYVTDEEVWLLLEKRSNELKAYLCWGLDAASLRELVSLAHARWTIEQFHRDAKQELALDDFEGRSWHGWHHHVSLVLLAHAFLATLRAGEGHRGPLPSLGRVVQALVHEAGTQVLMRKHGLARKGAATMAADVIREVHEWGR